MVEVIQNFLGNRRAANYEVIVRKMIPAYGKMGVNMSLRIYLLDAHLECFPENCGAFSDEHGALPSGDGIHGDPIQREKHRSITG